MRQWEVRGARTPEEKLKSSFNEQVTGGARVAYLTEEEVADHRSKLAECVDTRSRASDRQKIKSQWPARSWHQICDADIVESNLFKF